MYVWQIYRKLLQNVYHPRPTLSKTFCASSQGNVELKPLVHHPKATLSKNL